MIRKSLLVLAALMAVSLAHAQGAEEGGVDFEYLGSYGCTAGESLFSCVVPGYSFARGYNTGSGWTMGTGGNNLHTAGIRNHSVVYAPWPQYTSTMLSQIETVEAPTGMGSVAPVVGFLVYTNPNNGVQVTQWAELDVDSLGNIAVNILHTPLNGDPGLVLAGTVCNPNLPTYTPQPNEVLTLGQKYDASTATFSYYVSIGYVIPSQGLQVIPLYDFGGGSCGSETAAAINFHTGGYVGFASYDSLDSPMDTEVWFGAQNEY